MERVTGGVDVVDYDLDDVAVLDDKGIDLAVDGGIGVVAACCGCRVQSWNLLSDVGLVVEACADF